MKKNDELGVKNKSRDWPPNLLSLKECSGKIYTYGKLICTEV